MNPFKNKKERNLLKSIVCLVFSLLFFAFAFCPVADFNVNSDLSLSLPYVINEKTPITAMDYIEIMGVVSRQYKVDQEDDTRLVRELGEIGDKLIASMNDDKDNGRGSVVLSRKTKTLMHEYTVEYLKYYCSINTASQYDLARFAMSGALSLVWMVLGAALIIVSTISVARSALDIQGKNVSKLKATHEEYVLPVFLFVTLATLFVMPLTYFSVLNAAMISCLTFESFAVALVAIYAIAIERTETGTFKHLWIKLVSFVLAVTAIGCCFAPSFQSCAWMELDNYRMYEFYVLKSDISLLSAGNISWATYNKLLDDTPAEEFFSRDRIYNELSVLGNSILLIYNVGTIQDELLEEGLKEPLQESLLAMKTKEESCALSAGYFLVIFAVLILGVAASMSLCPQKKSIAISILVLIVLALALLIGTLVFAVDMVNTINKFMKENYIHNYTLYLDGGIISAFVFAVCAMIINILIVAGIGVNKKKSVETEEDVIEVYIENIVGSGTEKEDIFEM